MAGPFSGFIKAARGAGGGVVSMADAIGSAFSTGAADAAAAGRWMASESMGMGTRAAKGTERTAVQTYQAPLVKIGPVTLLPSLESVGSSIGRAVKSPSPSNVGDAALGVANMALLGKGEGGVGVFGAAARALERGGGLAGEAGAMKPGFLRDASEVFAANRAAKLADVAGETASTAQKAVKAAKMLVSPETNLVMTKAEQAGSRLVPEAQVVGHGGVAVENATNAGVHAAESAAEAAKGTAKAVAEDMPVAPGKAGRFANYVAKKGLAVAKSPVTGTIEAGKSFVSAGRDIVQAVTHPQLLSRPFSAPARAAGTVGKVVGKTTMGTLHALPAAAVAAGTTAVVQDLRRPGAGDAADKEMAKNMGMSVEDFRGIRAVARQKGEAGLAALVSGLKKARAGGLGALESSSNIAAKAKAKSLLRTSVTKAYKMRG